MLNPSKYFDKEEFSDIKVKISDKTYHAHKIILGECDYMKAVMKYHKDGIIELEDDFLPVLLHLYNKEIEITYDVYVSFNKYSIEINRKNVLYQLQKLDEDRIYHILMKDDILNLSNILKKQSYFNFDVNKLTYEQCSRLYEKFPNIYTFLSNEYIDSHLDIFMNYEFDKIKYHNKNKHIIELRDNVEVKPPYYTIKMFNPKSSYNAVEIKVDNLSIRLSGEVYIQCDSLSYAMRIRCNTNKITYYELDVDGYFSMNYHDGNKYITKSKAILKIERSYYDYSFSIYGDIWSNITALFRIREITKEEYDNLLAKAKY